ncbi:MAG TPA: hypothetical protein P5519_04975 [Spirochaetia bacterium]|nr:hypothetical protein [Spirochaetales bacterium]HQK33344.1 hypothetical protein [Spirochaetales bacterium]HRS65223.1 hypothetical protein [Spirochaetia bacterium]
MKRIILIAVACILPLAFFAVIWQTVQYHMLVSSIQELEVQQAKLIEILYMQEISKSIVSSRARIDTHTQTFDVYTTIDPSRMIRIVPSVNKKNDG